MKTPECDKLRSVSENGQAIGEFLDWLVYEKKVNLCESHEHDENCEDGEGEQLECELKEHEYIPFSYQIQNLLAEYFKIDLDKVETERRAILAELQKAQGAK